MNATARILSIEDDPQVRMSIVNWLEDSGYELLEAEDGIKGLEAFKEHRPDLVLLDMGLPGMPGQEVLAAIHEQSPQTPVVIVSANADISDAIGAFKAGAWDYVTKPILNFDVLEQTIRNCLERLHLRLEVRRAEERYGTLIQSVPVVVFSLGDNLALEFINDTCLDVTGFTPEEALADPCWLLSHTHPDDRDELRKALETEDAHPGEGFMVDFRFEHRKGYMLHLRARSLDREEGTHAATGGIITDVTESVFLEKVLVQREKLNTLGAISSELAHEIRNPLMSLGGFANRLAKKHPDLEEPHIILEQARRLEELLGRITSYVAPVEIKSQDVNVSALLIFCLDRLSPSLVRRQLNIRPRLELTLPDVRTDPDLLRDALTSLVIHLTDAMTSEGKLRIESREIAGHISVQFVLTDPGASPAFPESEEHLIMPFEEGGGTLELALAHRTMKDLGGSLSLSRRDETLTVTVSLPTEDARMAASEGA